MIELATMIMLLILAVIHVLWAFEVWWPIREERRLVAAVVGFEAATRMPGAIPCAAVAFALTSGAALIWLEESWIRSAGLLAYAAVFGVRGAMAYWGKWRRLTPQEPFATNDKWLFGPLCLALSVAMIWMAL